VTLQLPGRHAVANALLALAVAEMVGVPPELAVAGLAGVSPNGMRGEVRRIGGLTVVVDCYNANPMSVRAALDLLEGHAAARRVVVLGTMLELGDATAALHAEVLSDALSREVDLVVATGAFSAAASGLASREEERLLAAADWGAAYPKLRERLSGDEVVLLKASRGVALEGVLPLLEADFAGTPASPEGGEEV
jgi:UDP-N-acetylmuramoyl-tripeptide--D-alanyl-D-alanine ligase